jgi:lipoate---protein ligase
LHSRTSLNISIKSFEISPGIMLIFHRLSTDPYINIAAEEYFVKHSSDDICMIWTNEKSVIIGKHQNAYAEINYPFVKSHNIPVIRRISGGGAVYHDSGNVNFTFIQKTNKTNQVDFNRFTSIVVQFMQSVGIVANVGKRNSIFAGEKKFSGHAEHLFHDRVLHHGTILFDSDLNVLQNSLTPTKKYIGKAMESVRSEVCNIAPLLPEKIDIQEFTRRFVAWLLEYFPKSFYYQLSPEDTEAIQKLAETRYKTWDWNFGYSPAYTFSIHLPIQGDSATVNFIIKNGRFIKAEFSTTEVGNELSEIINSIIGVLHKEEEIDNFVTNNSRILELTGLTAVTFREAFFS